jgi:hypothetical protein
VRSATAVATAAAVPNLRATEHQARTEIAYITAAPISAAREPSSSSPPATSGVSGVRETSVYG